MNGSGGFDHNFSVKEVYTFADGIEQQLRCEQTFFNFWFRDWR